MTVPPLSGTLIKVALAPLLRTGSCLLSVGALIALVALSPRATAAHSFDNPDAEAFLRFFDVGGWNPAGNTTLTWTDNVTLPGWYALYHHGGNDTYTTPPTFRVTTGASLTSISLHLYRPAGGSVHGSLGVRNFTGPVGNPADGGGTFIGTAFVNDTGAPITSFSLGYTGEQWRASGGDPSIFTVSYSTDASSLATGSWTALDDMTYQSQFTSTGGNRDPRTELRQEYREVFRPTTITLDEPLQPGETVWVRWFSPIQEGDNQGIGIDEIRLTANPVAHFNTALTVGTDADPRGFGWNYADQVMQIGEGAAATGSVTVPAGETLPFYDLYIGAGDATATGSLTVSGPDAAARSTRDTGFGSVLMVGVDGTGSVLVENGAILERRKSSLGINPGSEGTITVTGAGSQFVTPTETVDVGGEPTEQFTPWNLYVGVRGTGTLNVLDGAVVDGVQDFSVGVATDGVNSGTGTVMVGGGGTITTSSFLRIGDAAGTTGTFTVTGEDSRLNLGGFLHVGSGGDGTLVVADGGVADINGTLSVGAGIRAGEENAVGHLHITGAGSLVSNNDFFYVGRAVAGSILVEDGGVATTTGSFRLGRDPTGVGTGVVRGEGSLIFSDNLIYVGDQGEGHLTVEAGGRVETSGGLSVSATTDATSIGHLHVTGAGSSAVGGTFVRIGRFNQGTLLVEDGGKVEAVTSDITIGSGAVSTGVATITGAGSQLIANVDLRLGNLGVGTLQVLDGGYTEVGTVLQLTSGSASSGTLLVQGTDALVHVKGDLLAGANMDAEMVVSATGRPAMVTVADGGHVQVDGVSALRGPGTLHFAGGTLTTAGLFDAADADSTLSFLLAAPGFQGFFAGDVLFDGTNLTIGLGFQPQIDDLFVLIDVAGSGGIAGKLAYDGNLLSEGDTFRVTDGAFEQYFQITYLHDGNSLALAAVIPEPATWAALFGLGALGLVILRRRQRTLAR